MTACEEFKHPCEFEENDDLKKIELLLLDLHRQMDKLRIETTKTVIEQNDKIANLCNYFNTNLKDMILEKIDSMKITGELDELITDSMINDIDSLKIYATPQMYGAYGDGVHDDSLALIEALENNDNVQIPAGTYLINRPLIFDKYVHIHGVDVQKTKLIYRPIESGNFITATHQNGIKITDITIECEKSKYDVNGVVIARNGYDTPSWGGKIYAENVVIKGFSNTQLKIYAPFCCYANNLTVTGTGFTRNEFNKNLCNGESIGIELIGYEANKIDTFGNCSQFNNSFVQQCKYGLKITSCVGIEFNNTVFEPNFINVYTPHTKGNNGDYTRLKLNACWMEDYTGQSHPLYGAYSIFDINEKTGLIPEPRPSRGARIELINCAIHSSCKQDYTMGVFTHYLGGTNATFKQLKEINKPLIQFNSVDGSLIDVNANQSFFYGQLASRQGYKLYDCMNDYNNLGEDLKLYSHTVYNPNTNKTEQFDFKLPERYTYTEPTETIVDVYMWCTGGFTCWYRVQLAGKNIINKQLMNDDGLFARDIDGNNKGLKVTSSEDGYVTLTMKAVTCEYARIDIKKRKLMK